MITWKINLTLILKELNSLSNEALFFEIRDNLGGTNQFASFLSANEEAYREVQKQDQL